MQRRDFRYFWASSAESNESDEVKIALQGPLRGGISKIKFDRSQLKIWGKVCFCGSSSRDSMEPNFLKFASVTRIYIIVREVLTFQLLWTSPLHLRPQKVYFGVIFFTLNSLHDPQMRLGSKNFVVGLVYVPDVSFVGFDF